MNIEPATNSWIGLISSKRVGICRGTQDFAHGRIGPWMEAALVPGAADHPNLRVASEGPQVVPPSLGGPDQGVDQLRRQMGPMRVWELFLVCSSIATSNVRRSIVSSACQ